MRKISLIIFSILFFSISCNIKTYDMPPEISIVLPETNTFVTDSVIVKCLCSDDNEIDRVELWIDAEKVDSLVLRSEPFNFILFAKDFARDQRIVLTARAYDDEDNFKDSEPIYLTMYKIDQKPSVQIIYPTDEIEVTDSIVVVCEATDDSDIQKVELLINGISNSEHVCYSEPYEFTINADDYFNTRLQLVAKAYDDAYQYTYSEPVYITIKHEINDNGLSELFGGQYLFMGASDRNIYRYDFSNASLDRMTFDNDYQYPGYLDDSKKVIYKKYSESSFYTMNVDGTNQEQFYYLPTDFIAPDYCSLNSTLYFYCNESTRKISCIDDNGFRYITEPANYDDSRPSINSNGTRLLFTSNRTGENQIFMKDLNSNTDTQVAFSDNKLNYSEWSDVKNGFYFVEFASASTMLKFCNLDNNSIEVIFESAYNFHYFPSPDEKYFAIAMNTSGFPNLYVYNSETKKLTQLTNDTILLNNIIWVDPN